MRLCADPSLLLLPACHQGGVVLHILRLASVTRRLGEGSLFRVPGGERDRPLAVDRSHQYRVGIDSREWMALEGLQ